MKSSGPFRKKFERRQEDFICEICQTITQGNGYTNHCPECLYSKHVDINPGDRSASCQGMMKPVSKGLDKKGYYLIHHCLKCEAQRRIKILECDNKDVINSLPFA